MNIMFEETTSFLDLQTQYYIIYYHGSGPECAAVLLTVYSGDLGFGPDSSTSSRRMAGSKISFSPLAPTSEES